eukprot:GAHX01000969.1.p1 GENE.GAHX01000969.1~~GAHX01000969.1.p1  ORF type:complete len:483 (+),score=83.10 GAHX01000969.1:42-1490(+)
MLVPTTLPTRASSFIKYMKPYIKTTLERIHFQCKNFKPTVRNRLNPLPNKSNFQVKGTSFEVRPKYLDNIATTKVDPRVVDAMMPYLCGMFGNSGSRTHLFGWETESAVEEARQKMASLINCKPSELIFTSGATEADNLAAKGYLEFLEESGELPKDMEIITVATEHKAVLETFRFLEQKGYNVHYITPKPNGMIDLDDFKKLLNERTRFVSIMHINNEIGIVQDIKKISGILQEHNRRLKETNNKNKRIVFHVDAAQSVGKINVDCQELGVDMFSISGHKIYGPKGIGVLYINSRPPVGRRIRLKAMVTGGGQERGIRSGTLPVPLVVGLGKAAELAKENMKRDHDHVTLLSDKLKRELLKETGVYLNGSGGSLYPGCNNFSFDFVEGESLLMGLKDLALSSGSACTSASLEPSYVLKALGVGDELAHTSIRYGIGRFTREAEIDEAIKKTKEWVSKLKELSPLYEMVQEGIDLKSIEWAE